MRGIWLHTVRKWVTGTLIGSKYSLDVNVANTVAIPTTPSESAFLEYRHQDFSVTGANASGGAYVEIGDTGTPAADIAATVSKMKVANNSGSSLLLGTGANAAAVTVIAVVQAGQTSEAVFGVTLVAGDKVWVKALENTAVSVGKLLVTFY